MLPRYYWITEMNGYGRAYREWLSIPNWAPLPFYGDHGVLISSYLVEHELHNNNKVFFTFSRSRYQALKASVANKKIVRIPCPWIMYRRKKNITQSENAQGTLIFIPKSLPELKFNYSLNEYVSKIFDSNQFESPYSFVVHHHDLKSEIHGELEKFKLPIITFGSDSFYSNVIDNFYSTVANYSAAVSPNPGSELYYCHEMGLKFSKICIDIEGVAETQKIRDVFKNQSQDDLSVRVWSELHDLFSDEHTTDRFTQDTWIENMLSLDLANESYTNQIRSLVISRYLPETPGYFKNISSRLFNKIKPF